MTTFDLTRILSTQLVKSNVVKSFEVTYVPIDVTVGLSLLAKNSVQITSAFGYTV